jgi:hypothetical protein
VLGAVFAMHVAEGVGTRGLATAYFGGGIGELIGAAVAFAFIRCDSLRRPAQLGRERESAAVPVGSIMRLEWH